VRIASLEEEDRNSMKILLVTFSDNADHQDTLFGMYECVRERADVSLLAIQKPKVPLDMDKHVWLVDCPKRPGVTRKTFDVKLLAQLIHRIRKERFDVIYFESLHVWNLPIMLFAGKATVFHEIHDVIPHEGDKQARLVDWMNRAICKLTDYIVLKNKTYIDQMSRTYHFPRDRIRYCALWRRYPAYTKPQHTKDVLFFGRMNPYKGVENLLQIAKACPEIHFSVVGKVDPQVEETVCELSALPNVTVQTGYVSDEEMKDAFTRADWIIAPYRSATQSGVVTDAYKYARPVVAFDVGAIPEQVVDGISGYLVPAGDNDAFSACLRKAVQMPEEEYDRMTRQAYDFGREKYAAAGAVNRFLALVTDV